MNFSSCARRIARFVAPAAPILLVLPAVVLAVEMTRWTWLPWIPAEHNVVRYQVPRIVIALAAAAAAVMVLMRTRRGFGVGLGVVAALAAGTVPFVSSRSPGIWWTRYGAFGDSQWINGAWSVATVAVLLCVPRIVGTPDAAQARVAVRGVAAAGRFYWAAPIAGGLLFWFGVPYVEDAFDEFVRQLNGWTRTSPAHFALIVAVGFVPFAVATLLVRPRFREDVVHPIRAKCVAVMERFRRAARAILRLRAIVNSTPDSPQ